MVDLPDDELAAVTAAIRRAIEDDKFPHAPRLDPLRAALARVRGGDVGRSEIEWESFPPGSNLAPEGPAASQSRQAGAAITARRRRRRT
jgi:hypothetical protein